MQIEELIERIKQQQKDMGYFDLCKKSKEFRMSYIRDISLALHKEVSEFLDEVPWKPWKAIDEQSYDKVKAMEEIADIIVFAVVLFVTLNKDEDVDLDYLMGYTMNKIENRIKTTGYGHQEIKI